MLGLPGDLHDPEQSLSRREAIGALGRSLAFGMVAGRLPLTPAQDTAQRSQDLAVDVHVHVVNPGIPGIPEMKSPRQLTLAPFDAASASQGRARLVAELESELRRAGVGQALCMPRWLVNDEDPLGIAEVEAIAALAREVKLHAVGFANPERFDRPHLARVERVLEQRRVRALKVALGYLPYEPSGAGYLPYYELAAKYKIPVIFHTGSNYSRIADVRFAHPLAIDRVAVRFPETKFVLAHFGNPWVLDAALVAYKNENVWADLSGILVGDDEYFAKIGRSRYLGHTVEQVGYGVEWVESAKKFMFGSDWPLAPLGAYRDFVKRLFPNAVDHAGVFGGNAKEVFSL